MYSDRLRDDVRAREVVMDEEREDTECGGVVDDNPPYLTMNRKWILFHKHLYKCPMPPIPTLYWGVQDWVRHIDQNGEWILDES